MNMAVGYSVPEASNGAKDGTALSSTAGAMASNTSAVKDPQSCNSTAQGTPAADSSQVTNEQPPKGTNSQEVLQMLQSSDSGIVYLGDELDADEIQCSRCGVDDSTDENDILLCDYIGCGRAYHQYCQDPPTLVVPAEDEDWLCNKCSVIVKFLAMLADEFGVEVSSWRQLWPENELQQEFRYIEWQEEQYNTQTSEFNRTPPPPGPAVEAVEGYPTVHAQAGNPPGTAVQYSSSHYSAASVSIPPHYADGRTSHHVGYATSHTPNQLSNHPASHTSHTGHSAHSSPDTQLPSSYGSYDPYSGTYTTAYANSAQYPVAYHYGNHYSYPQSYSAYPLSQSYSQSYSHAQTYSDTQPFLETQAYPDPQTFPETYASHYTAAYPQSQSYPHSYSQSHSYSHRHAYSHHSQTQVYPNPQTYQYAHSQMHQQAHQQSQPQIFLQAHSYAYGYPRESLAGGANEVVSANDRMNSTAALVSASGSASGGANGGANGGASESYNTAYQSAYTATYNQGYGAAIPEVIPAMIPETTQGNTMRKYPHRAAAINARRSQAWSAGIRAMQEHGQDDTENPDAIAAGVKQESTDVKATTEGKRRGGLGESDKEDELSGFPSRERTKSNAGQEVSMHDADKANKPLVSKRKGDSKDLTLWNISDDEDEDEEFVPLQDDSSVDEAGSGAEGGIDGRYDRVDQKRIYTVSYPDNDAYSHSSEESESEDDVGSDPEDIASFKRNKRSVARVDGEKAVEEMDIGDELNDLLQDASMHGMLLPHAPLAAHPAYPYAHSVASGGYPHVPSASAPHVTMHPEQIGCQSQRFDGPASRKRARHHVDYRALALHMFGSLDEEEAESEEGDFVPPQENPDSLASDFEDDSDIESDSEDERKGRSANRDDSSDASNASDASGDTISPSTSSGVFTPSLAADSKDTSSRTSSLTSELLSVASRTPPKAAPAARARATA